MALSAEAADELGPIFAAAHWVPSKDGTRFYETPVQTRGISHGLMPGVHSALDNVGEAIETLRGHLGRADAPTTDALLCLPFGAFSQGLAPISELTVDPTTRLCVRDPLHPSTRTGRAYLPDATSEEDAVVREPLFRRPGSSTFSENCYATSYEHLDSFVNAAAAVGLLARCVSEAEEEEDPVGRLWSAMDAFMMQPSLPSSIEEGSILFVGDALLLLNSMYPITWLVAEPCIVPALAVGVPALARLVEEQAGRDELADGAPLCRLVSAELLEGGRKWWAAFRRFRDAPVEAKVCGWRDAVAPLLRALERHDGSHFVPEATTRKVRVALEQAVQGGWLVHSKDGVSPPPPECPAHPARAPAYVRRPVVDPLFHTSLKAGTAARGCLVSIKPHQLRQLYALCLGSHLPNAEAQVVRNEGALVTALHASSERA